MVSLRAIASSSAVSGTAAPNAIVTVENLSVAPYAPLADVLVTRVKADARGNFSLPAASAMKGDVLRVRSGADVIDLIAAGSGKTRRPEVEVQGLMLTESSRGVDVTNVLSNPAIAAPFTELCFEHNGARVRYVVPADGTAPASLPFAVKPGDRVDIYVGDAKKRWASRTVVGAAGDPPKDRDTHGATLTQTSGRLFVNGATFDDAQQGDVGDCWIISALSAIANTRPEGLKSLVTERADGSYLVRLQAWDAAKKKFVSAAQIVPSLFYVKGGALAYASSKDDKELWPAIVERAYAQWKGSYDAIAVGYPYAAFEALLGAKGSHTPFDAIDDEALYASAVAAAKQPTIAVTFPPKARKFTEAGLVSDHAYTVLSAFTKNGERFVKLRNPWGSFEPAGNGKDDGVFVLTLADYRKFFAYSCAAVEPPGRHYESTFVTSVVFSVREVSI